MELDLYRPDVVGAIFGQTEGLLGEELDLRELQKTGRIGRIQVNIDSNTGKSIGQIIIPSSLNRIETSILASALETVDRVGPCLAKIILKQIEDIRETKRKQIVERAANILKHWEADTIPESQEIANRVVEEAKVGEISQYGPENLPAGPNVLDSDELIIVEGRADILNLLKCGVTNTIAVEGTNIPKSLAEIAKNKKITVFLDSDRGGELILKEIKQMLKIDFVIKAPDGKSVEELTKKEMFKCLKNKMTFKDITATQEQNKNKQKKIKKEQKNMKKKVQQQPIAPPVQQPKGSLNIDPILRTASIEVKETLFATIFDKTLKPIEKIGVQELTDKLTTIQAPIKAIVFDGVVTQRLLDIAEEKQVEIIICARIGNITKKPNKINIMAFSQLNLN